MVSMNVVLLLFNLVPAFPLDGGRIARAVAWKVTGDRNRATRLAARVGIGFGWLLVALGIWIAVTGSAFDGIWFAALGWLLASAARGALAQSAVNEQLAGVTVADVMDAEPVTIPAGLSVERAFEDYFLRYQGWEWFAVVEDDGRFAGLARRAAIEHAARVEGGAMPVREVIARGDREAQVPADAPLEVVLGSEPLRRLGALMAVDGDGRLRGVITFEQVTRALRTRLAPMALARAPARQRARHRGHALGDPPGRDEQQEPERDEREALVPGVGPPDAELDRVERSHDRGGDQEERTGVERRRDGEREDTDGKPREQVAHAAPGRRIGPVGLQLPEPAFAVGREGGVRGCACRAVRWTARARPRPTAARWRARGSGSGCR